MSRIRVFIIVLLLVSPSLYAGDITLPWSTTFDCAECTQPTTPDCDGQTWQKSEGTLQPSYSQITSDANYSGGKGGRGLRVWYGDGATNDGSNGTSVTFIGGGVYELWVRYYIRWASDFTTTSTANGIKTIFFHGTPTTYTGDRYSMDGHLTYRMTRQAPGDTGYTGALGDYFVGMGIWHCVEYHIKSESGYHLNDSVTDIWLDGVKLPNTYRPTADNPGYYGFWTSEGVLGQGITYIHIMGNITGTCTNATDNYVDIDDIAIYATTPPNLDAEGNPFIGPLDWSSPSTPSLRGVGLHGVDMH